MNDNVAILISTVVILIGVLLVSRKFRLSSRYERAPRTLNTWSAQDKGMDPSDEKEE